LRFIAFREGLPHVDANTSRVLPADDGYGPRGLLPVAASVFLTCRFLWRDNVVLDNSVREITGWPEAKLTECKHVYRDSIRIICDELQKAVDQLDNADGLYGRSPCNSGFEAGWCGR
jgi:hypothetical protein